LIRRSLVANYLSGAWSAVMGIAFVPVYLKYLGVEAYGLIGVFASMQVWFALLDMGMAPALNREMARYRAGAHTSRSILDLFYSLETVYLVVALVIAGVIALCAPWLSVNWFKTVELSMATVQRSLMLIGLVIALRWVGTLYRGALIGLQRQVWLSSCNAIFATLRAGGVAVVIANVSATLEAFFLYQACLGCVESLVLSFGVRKGLPRDSDYSRFSKDALRQVSNFASGVAVITVLSILLTQIDKLFLSKLLPLEQFGYYSLATTAASGLYLLVTPVANVAYPRLTTLVTYDDPARLSATYHAFSQLLTLMLIPASLVMAIFPRHFLLLWTRDEAITAAVAPLFSMLLLGNMLNGIMHTPFNLQLAHGWTRLTININFFSLVVFIPAIYFGVSKFGAIAAAVAWATLNLGYLVVTVPLMHRALLAGEKWTWYVSDVGVPLSATLAVVLILHALLPEPNIHDPLKSIEAITLAAAAAFSTAAASLPMIRSRTVDWIAARRISK
jgi:O-antigen/teichoic acid export membrane protein